MTMQTGTNNKILTRKYHRDHNNGWLCVKISELEALQIADKISNKSYMKKQSAYLDDKGDMNIYIHEIKQRGYSINTVDGKVFEKTDHPIKRFQPYKYGTIKAINRTYEALKVA